MQLHDWIGLRVRSIESGWSGTVEAVEPNDTTGAPLRVRNGPDDVQWFAPADVRAIVSGTQLDGLAHRMYERRLSGQPVFPRTEYGDGMNVETYLAAHAPDEIPDWFNPPHPAFTGIPPEWPFPDGTTVQTSEPGRTCDMDSLFRVWQRDPCFELTDDVFPAEVNAKLAAYAAAGTKHLADYKAHNEAAARARYFGWRWEFAAGVLKHQPA